MIITRKKIEYRAGNSYGFSLLSDFHIGSPDTQEQRIVADLDRAAQKGDRVAINGDVFDAIISRDAKRYTPSGLAKWLRGRSDILNASLDRAYDLLRPYARLIDVIGVGNHEATVEKYGNVDLIRLLVDRLNGSGGRVAYGGYTGFLDYSFVPARRAGREGTGFRFTIFYHHGAGSGSTLGAAANQFPKVQQFVAADVLWLGHKHHRIGSGMRHVSCPRSGNTLRVRDVRYAMSGAYMLAYRTQTQRGIRRTGRQEGYAVEALLPPQPVGGARVEVECGGSGIKRVTVET